VPLAVPRRVCVAEIKQTSEESENAAWLHARTSKDVRGPAAAAGEAERSGAQGW